MEDALERIEADLIARRGRPAGVSCAIPNLLGSLVNENAEPVLWAAMKAIARAADDAASHGPQPAYHNNFHVTETILAIMWLCQDALARSLLSARDALIGAIAMVGHDLGHDGSIPEPGLLEGQARTAVCAIGAGVGMDASDLHLVGELIMATQPELVEANAARLHRCPHDAGALLRVFTNEADAFASFLPSLGPRLTEALAQERALAGNPAMLAAPAWHRVAFLRSYRMPSPSAVRLGLLDARNSSYRAYAAAGGLIGTTATVDAGAEALDSLAPAQARVVYERALAARARTG